MRKETLQVLVIALFALLFSGCAIKMPGAGQSDGSFICGTLSGAETVLPDDTNGPFGWGSGIVFDSCDEKVYNLLHESQIQKLEDSGLRTALNPLGGPNSSYSVRLKNPVIKYGTVVDFNSAEQIWDCHLC